VSAEGPNVRAATQGSVPGNNSSASTARGDSFATPGQDEGASAVNKSRDAGQIGVADLIAFARALLAIKELCVCCVSSMASCMKAQTPISHSSA
jgi:hypothetical protein